MSDLTAIGSLACFHEGPLNDPAANPYRIEFACALGLLLIVFVVWRHVDPRPRRILRWYAGTGGALAFAVMLSRICMYAGPTARVEGCRFVVEAALLVTASLLLELVLSLRHPGVVPRASAARLSRRVVHHGRRDIGHR